MNDFNAADTRAIRARQRELKAREAERKLVVLNLMSSPAGRAYVHDRLQRCHIFETTFVGDALRSAFLEGERNIGLADLAEVMRWCPDQYVQMMREQNDKELANERRLNNRNGNGTTTDADSGWDVGGPLGRVASEYDPRDEPGDDATDGAGEGTDG